MDENLISNPFDQEENKDTIRAIDDVDTSRRSLIWILLGIVVLGCVVILCAALFYFQPDAKSLYAQYFPTPTSTPSVTPTFTSTPSPTATNTPTPTPNMTATVQVQNAQTASVNALNNWKVVFSDPFDSNKNKWVVESNSKDEYATVTYEITDGKYRWDATAHQSFISWVGIGKKKPLGDFYLSADVQVIEAPDTADYGLVFREDEDSNFYYFAINGQGQYALYKFYKEWSVLIPWVETDLLKTGEANHLTVIGEGSRFTFFVNDQYIAEFTDDSIPEGSTSLAIELSEENDHAVFEFDNFELRAP